MTALAKPQLPKKLVKRLEASSMGFASWVYSEDGQYFRRMACCGPDADITDNDVLLRKLRGTNPSGSVSIVQHASRKRAMGRWWPLHFAVETGDVLMAHEVVRLGACIEEKHEQHGVSPLARATARLTMLVAKGTSTHDPDVSILLDDAEVQRYRAIMRMFAEQHANVNVTTTTLNPQAPTALELLAYIQDWEMLALFLEHGGERHTSLFTKLQKRNPPEWITTMYHAMQTRPQRKCPCFSGLDLADCHAVRLKPYPDAFICTCRSKNKESYKACCKKREIFRWEFWDEKEEWIAVASKHAFKDEKERKLRQRAGGAAFSIMADKDKESFVATKIADYLEEHGGQAVDPAFLWTMRNTNILMYRIYTRSMDREPGRLQQARWNAGVDEYIALGTDPRPKIDIERAAKINSSLGPLFSTCEGPGCGRMEGRDVEKLGTCSVCHMAKYCSPVCQKADWKEHKTICNHNDQTGQELPSSRVLSRLMTGLHVPQRTEGLWELFAFWQLEMLSAKYNPALP